MRTFLLMFFLAVLAVPAGAQEARVMYVADVAKLADIPGLTGITVDIFWCAGDDETDRRSGIAAEVGAALAAFARFTDPVSTGIKTGQFLRSVRIRPLDDAGSAALPFAAIGKDVALVPDSKELRSFVETLLRYAGQPIAVTETSQDEIGSYVPIYICGTLSQPKVSKRIYLQVANKDQVSSADEIISNLRRSVNGAFIAYGVEVMNELSPTNTEVRYFFDDDETFAAQVSELVSTSLAIKANAKFVPGYSSERNRGLVEVWVGATYEPTRTTTSFVCVGDNEANCPSASAWVTCDRNLDEWAATARSCQKSNFTDMGISTAGGQCGYKVYQLTCTTDGQTN